MAINVTCSRNVNGEQFFNYLKTRSCNKSYLTVFEYIKQVTQELNPDQPFYVLNFADVLWKLQLWNDNFPHIKPYYAVKANRDPMLIKLFVLLGLSFDCATKGEIDLVLEQGGNPKDIIFAHTIKPTSSLEYAATIGVDFMTFDCKEELFKIQKYFPTAKLLLRLKYENLNCSYNLGIKYGCSIVDAEELLKTAKDMDVNIIGVSFHVGGLCDDPSSFTKSICNCRSVFDIAKQLQLNLTIIDVGAGFFGSKEKDQTFYKRVSQINMALMKYFPENDIQVIAEPGCFFVCSSQRTVSCVIGKRFINTNTCNDNNEVHYFLNDGRYGSFFKLFEAYDIYPIPLIEPDQLKKRVLYKSKVWGQTCRMEDLVLDEYLMPEMEMGECTVWENTGAYTLGLWTNFCIVPQPTARYIFTKDIKLQLDWIQRQEDIKEFITKNAILIESGEFP